MTSTEEVTAPSELPQEEMDALIEATQRAYAEHPAFRLLDPENATWHQLEGPGQHVMTLMGIHGVFDVASAQFVADDPELVRALVLEQLVALVGETPVAGGERPRSVDWSTLTLGQEGGGILSATAMSLPDADDNDAVHQLELAIDMDLQPAIVSEELVSGGATGQEGDGGADDGAAVVDGNYLGSHYGDAEFPFDGRGFVIDWTTWDTDQTTDEGLVGSAAEATSDGVRFQLYAWFDPAVGIQIVQATALGAAEAEGAETADAPAHGITADYLGGHYADSPLPFDGVGYVVDWTTWDPDQVTDDGMVGSKTVAVDHAGRRYDLYVWFDAANGARIVQATALDSEDDAAADAAGQDTVDPQAYFADVLTPALRERWAGNGNTLAGSSGDYDVSAWINGDYGGELEFVDHDGAAYFATVTATTADDDAQPVRCQLRIVDADTVTVESVDSLS